MRMSAECRERAKVWRDKAASLPEGDPERALCLEIADGYERLAEQRERLGNDDLVRSR